MSDLSEYIDGATRLIRLCMDKNNESKESKDLEIKITSLWKKLTEEEQMYADEEMLRIQLYLAPNEPNE